VNTAELPRIYFGYLKRMPSVLNVLLCALSQFVLAICVGLPVTRKLASERALALALAPAMGWAVFSTLALPILSWVGFSRATVTLLCGIAIVGGARRSFCPDSPQPRRHRLTPPSPVGLYRRGPPRGRRGPWRMAEAGRGGLVLADPMFDHSKVAIIDDIVRLGLPPGNPFYGGADARHLDWPITIFGTSAPPL
jgi:hypothetical protein